MVKRAKLAHEKRQDAKVEAGSTFAVKKVIELVEDKSGKAGAIVELDDSGTLGIIDRGYVMADADGGLIPRQIACPATYDAVAQQEAVARYQAHAG